LADGRRGILDAAECKNERFLGETEKGIMPGNKGRVRDASHDS